MEQSRPSASLCLALCLLGAAVVAGANITMIWREAQTSSHDMARGEPLETILFDPFVITFGAPIIALSGLFAFLLVYYWLKDTVVWMSLATLYTVVLAEVLIVGLDDPMLAWFAAYPTLLAAGGFSKLIYRRGEPSVSNVR